MSSSKSWYSLKSKAIPSRYGLSKNIQTLLQSLEDYQNGSLDATELGRLVRLSPQRRSAIANTITKCANIIKKQPSEIKTCVDIIEMCTEILEIADKRPPIQAFPFMKLPVEIRDKILDLMIKAVFRIDLLVPATNASACRCPSIDRGSAYQTAQMKALPTLLGTSLNHEFCRSFFRKKTFRFRCACELLVHLSRGGTFKDNVRHVNVHWCGLDSATAFKMLAQCPYLESLTVSISKSTYTHMNGQGELMRSFFHLSFRNTRLMDVLGFEELLAIRGLKSVRASHAQPKSNTSFAAELERAGLSSLLSSKLTLPPAEHDDSD
ncbi:hypothetical protein HRG_005614 [Hirsutella rhossiliensis]|uniref:Uncharacterized protein n=1 Tax=Hirsutella rhossiliensis TaxID=111463 RepID=A0A9P8MZD9_9HYPO|nr:uncharacterized protein HRG_05614 [Hirsutella rhossiliensis]KAH0963104.1 hypothetical protein HRG_05614 [Hirsutella rhossiliensis]